MNQIYYHNILSDFRKYHAANPHVYQLFRRFTLQVINTGRERYGAKSIFEQIRWHTEIESKGEDFKINNNYTPFYARMFMYEYPQNDGFFRLRTMRNADKFQAWLEHEFGG
jgi:hypothetical protein